MKSKLLSRDNDRTYAVVFETGEEVMSGLQKFARENRLDACHFTAIGAFRDATLAFFDPDQKEYLKIPVAEQVEVLSLVGDITLDNDQPMVHAHVVVGTADGTARGGHLLQAHVRPTLEVMAVETPGPLRRRIDPESGLALIAL
ncbi:MAG: DNA-binding protein [Thermomicrobiales bacterium]|nr:DNA-binding protein [Thermomicrobiales bacterium]